MGIEFNQNVNPSAVTFNGSEVSAVRFNGIHVWPDGLNGFYYKVSNGTLFLSVEPRYGYADASSALTATGSTNVPWYSSRNSITSVRLLDGIAPQSLMYWFACINLSSIIGIENLDTSSLTNMAQAFGGCRRLPQLGILDLDTSHVTSMSNTFSMCGVPSNYTLSPNWDTSSVTTMDHMFYWINGFDGTYQPTNTFAGISLNFDCSNVQTVEAMFMNCRALSYDLSGCTNTSGITNYNYMFEGPMRATSIDFSNWDFSGATSCYGMFDGERSSNNSSLTSLDLSNFNPSQTFDATQMFRYQNHLTTLDLSGLDASMIGNSTDMFNGCTAMQTAYCRSAADKTILDAIVSASGQSWTFTVKE